MIGTTEMTEMTDKPDVEADYLVVGYYYKNNLGDDLFEWIFSEFFKRHFPNDKITIANSDKIKQIPSGTKAVILGGGGVVNDYFVSKILKLTNGTNLPKYAIGVGIPYKNEIQKGTLDQFDYIVHRSRVDQESLVDRYGSAISRWYPDISYLLKEYAPQCDILDLDAEFRQIFENNQRRNRSVGCGGINRCRNNKATKKIGIFLTRTIYNPNNPDAYDKIVRELAAFFVKLARQKKNRTSALSNCFKLKKEEPEYELYFFPFCDSPMPGHDDRIINRDIVEMMNEYDTFENVYLFEKKPKMNQLLTVFGGFHATVCSRFHAHMFSFMAGTPVLSVYTTRKVDNLLHEFHFEDYSIKMDTDEQDFPVNVDTALMQQKWSKLNKNYDLLCNDIQVMNELYTDKIKEFENLLVNLLYYQFKKPINKTNEIIHQIVSNLKLCYPHADLDDVSAIATTPGALNKILNNDNNTANAETVSDIVSYCTTNNRLSKYHWGLTQKVLSQDYTLKDSVEWILNDLDAEDYTKFLTNKTLRCYRKFNTQHINSNLLKGFHRSGWNYVLQHLDTLHNPKGITFDSYLDKTFGWDCDFFQKIGKIPFKQDWIGVFHHTPNEDYTTNNLVNVFKNQAFIDSLEFCKGIIVFSDYLCQFVKSELSQIGYKNTPVLSTYHPTERVDESLKFDWYKFESNRDKKVIQIGGWLRNSYAIYALPTPKNYQKCALKWIGMNNYYVDESDIDKIIDCINHIGGCTEICCGLDAHNTQTTNKYLKGLLEIIEANHGSVQCLEMIPNEQYDMLLTENVVFINLVDASAVNTLLECIVRNTPICINRLPAVVQYLGEDYPLYYDNLSEASQKIGDLTIVNKAHTYLKRMDKTNFDIEHLLKDIICWNAYLDLDLS